MSMSPSPASLEPSALPAFRPSPPLHHRCGRSPFTKSDRFMRWGEEAEGIKTWGRVEESLIRASGISLGASGVGLVQLRHREGVMVRRSGRQEERRREATRQALRRVTRLRVVGRLLRAIDNLSRAAAGEVEAAATAVHVSAFRASCPSAAAALPKGAAKTEGAQSSLYSPICKGSTRGT